VVVQGFEQAAKSKSEAWKLHKAVLKEFLRDFTSESSLSLALHSVLHKPFREHIQSYLRLLSQLQEQLQEGSERDVVAAVAQEFGKLESFIGQVLDEAGFTKELWKSLGYKFTDMLCVPERRLLEDSRNLPIASGTARSERLLLFDDVLVLIQGNSFQSFDLKLVWVDENCGEKSAPGLYSLRITTPEETFVLSTKDPQMKAVWRWKLEQAVRQALNGKRDFPLWGRSGEGSEAPSRRFFTYVFRMEGRLRGATYEGEWLWGKPHGKGTLKWRDGRNHVGDFQEGLEHGFGICLVPRRSEDRYDCYKCHWYQGKMRGYGICEYGNDLVYKGYFKDNVRQGFGILENFSAEHPFKYTGQWEKDKKNGYGVWEDKERGERYIGMWLDDHRHGEGIVVTQSGLCYQRTFHADKMVGSGILLLEDDSVYEGNFTENLTFVGK
ncbi:AL2CL protein, partial [Vidua macroura]|nr:AL2CL protein [Vidua macroura]